MPRVVIVGVGIAGLGAAQTLAKQLSVRDSTEIVVIEKNETFYHTFGAPRAYTEANYAANMFIPLDNLIPTSARGFARRVRGVVTAISADTNTVHYAPIGDDDCASDETLALAFDFLILATGSTYTVPIKPDAHDYSQSYMETKLAEVRAQIAKAERILVVGGGAAGCEVAGDIAAHYPTKHVTLLSSQPQLVAGNNVKDALRSHVMETLASLGVRVLLGERLEERLTGNGFEPCTLRTNKGTVLESDIQLLCAGFRPSSELVRSMDASLVDANGAIRVNDALQLDDPKYAHIFALGDATNHATPKTGLIAYRQGIHVAYEVAAMLRTTQRLVMPFPLVAVEKLSVPLGPTRGATQLPLFGGWVLGDWTTRLLMGRDMMAGRMWWALGATPPSS